MWISNAAATGMMLPIIQAILVELIKGDRRALHPTEAESTSGMWLMYVENILDLGYLMDRFSSDILLLET